MESTYGDSEHRESPEEVTDKLLAILQRAMKDGGHVLIPAFAIGRVQTLLHHLNEIGRGQQRLVSARVQPGITTPQQLYIEATPLQVRFVDVGNLQLAPGRRLNGLGKSHHVIVVKKRPVTA